MKFRKKPMVIEAMAFPAETPTLRPAFERWAARVRLRAGPPGREGIDIETLEGVMHADVGDVIIKGVKGEFYPCKPDIFEMTYEKAEDDS